MAALLANTGIAVTKFVAYLLTGYSSMLAEAVHSVADAGNQGLLLLGGKRAKQEATAEHPFGYGRERYVYAFVVAIVLFTVGGLFAFYEAYHKWEEVQRGDADYGTDQAWWWLPLVVLTAAIVMESFSLRTAIVESNRVRGKASWGTFVRKAKSPELPVVLLEDLAALLGLAFALVGVSLAILTQNGLFDMAGTVMIGLLLVTVAAILAVEMKSLLLGESATAENVAAIRGALRGTERGDSDVIHLRTLHVGPEEILVTAKLAIAEAATGTQIAEQINGAEARARAAVPDQELILYLEPDLRGVQGERPVWDTVPAALSEPGRSADADHAIPTEPHETR